MGGETSGGRNRGDSPEERLIAEARRVYLRYAVECVEGLTFCPYAERSRLDGHTLEIVLLGEALDSEPILDAVDAIVEDEKIEIGLLIFPQLVIDRIDFGGDVEDLRKGHAARYGGHTLMALEGFHPHAEADLSTPPRLTPFVRRTPDPTIQVTRLAHLEKIKRGSPSGTAFIDPATVDIKSFLKKKAKKPIHARIAEANHQTVSEMGAPAVEAIFEDILRDRDRSYALIEGIRTPRRLG